MVRLLHVLREPRLVVLLSSEFKGVNGNPMVSQ